MKRFKSRNERNKHFRLLTSRTDRLARRMVRIRALDARRIEAGPLGGMVHIQPLPSQSYQPQAQR
jgi:hypothetical protein